MQMRARYEFKYLISREQVDWIRQVVSCYAEPDPYGENGVYTVSSLYFDTWDWMTAMATVEGLRNRFKIRIRTYGFTDDDPVFLENKGRVGTSIVKSRALMARKYVTGLSLGAPPPEGGYVALKASHQPDLDSFRNYLDVLHMRPRLWVQYTREAWASAFGEGSRLTFDSDLHVQSPRDLDPFVPQDDMWTRVPLDGEQTILELKFNNAFPIWMQRIVHGLELFRVSCAKYVQGAIHIGDMPWNRLEGEGDWTVY